TMNRAYTIRNDALWSPIARDFANLPNGYDHDQAYKRYITARRATLDDLAALAPAIKGLLTPDQRRMLPSFIASYLEPRYLASIRSGTNGFTATSGFSGPQSFGGNVFVSAMGGGSQTVIIRQ
ncbi:MAG: hypothetical protein ACRD3J_28335, partial [Thermoanaerobaculia bacterium]